MGAEFLSTLHSRQPADRWKNSLGCCWKPQPVCIYFRITTSLLIKRAFSCDLCGEGEVVSLRQRVIAACCYAKMDRPAWLHFWKQPESSALTSTALNSPADGHTEEKKQMAQSVPNPSPLCSVRSAAEQGSYLNTVVKNKDWMVVAGRADGRGK